MSSQNTSALSGKWIDYISDFLREAGLSQALRGFQEDVFVMATEWEEKRVPIALKNLQMRVLVGGNVLNYCIFNCCVCRIWHSDRARRYLTFRSALKISE